MSIEIRKQSIVSEEIAVENMKEVLEDLGLNDYIRSVRVHIHRHDDYKSNHVASGECLTSVTFYTNEDKAEELTDAFHGNPTEINYGNVASIKFRRKSEGDNGKNMENLVKEIGEALYKYYV